MPDSTSKYETLTKLLQELGHKDLIVSKAVLFKIGGVAFAEALIPERSEFPISERQKLIGSNKGDYHPPKDIAHQVFTALEKHPNVFDLTTLGKSRGEMIWGQKLGLLVTGPAFSARIHLPKNQQKYQEFGKVEEHFRIVSSGSVFAAWSEIQGIPVLSSIAHEFREIVYEQVPKLTALKCPPLGPTPIHPDFVLVFCRRGAGGAGSPAHRDSIHPWKCFTRDSDLFVLFDDSVDVENAVWELFFDIRSELTDFYKVSISRVDAIGYEVEIYNRFSELSESFEALTRSPAWNVLATHKHSKATKEKLAILHTLLIEFENALLNCERDRNRMVERVRKSNILSGLVHYFSELVDPATRIPATLPQALQFFEGELQLYGNIHSLLAASLIGAVVGSVITGLFSLLLK